MKINKTFGDKIYIEWLDAYTDDGWVSMESALVESVSALCKTNAFFVGENKHFIVVSHTQGVDKKEDILGCLSIPKKWIRRVE